MIDFSPSGPRYRTVPEAAIVEMLFVNNWSFDVRDGERASAERAVRETLDRWVTMGLPHARSPDGGRLFDSVEIINFGSWAGARLGDPARVQTVAHSRRLVSDLHGVAPGGPPPAVAALGPRRFTVTFRRDFNLESFPVGARARLRLPRPLEDAGLRDLRLTPFAEDGLEPDFVCNPSHLEAHVAAPASRRVVLGFEAEFLAYPTLPEVTGASLDPAERALYLRPSEGVIKVTRRIRQLVSELAGGEGSDWSAVGRIWRGLWGKPLGGAVHYDQAGRGAPLDWVLDDNWIDCQLGSALIAALCRAQGIPARLICGNLLYPTAPTQHYWTEAWTPDCGWAPLDRFSHSMSNGVDIAWRDHFFGAVDYRMKTEILPRLFNSGGAVRLPASWRQLQRLIDGGVETSYHDTDTGALIYADQFTIKNAGEAPSR